MTILPQKDIERFLLNVDKEKSTIFYNGSRCWEWTACCNKKGYGSIRIRAGLFWKTALAHRIAYELFIGNLESGTLVCHHCDNPPCCNPDHLFTGTQNDNSQDKVKKNRQTRLPGEKNGRAKLTSEQVEEIRSRYGRNGVGGESQEKLSLVFGVSQVQISAIVNNKQWVE